MQDMQYVLDQVIASYLICRREATRQPHLGTNKLHYVPLSATVPCSKHVIADTIFQFPRDDQHTLILVSLEPIVL